MKRIILCSILVLCFVVSGCATNHDYETDIPYTGYDCTYWGMSKKDVLQLISYVDYYDESENEIAFKDARVLNMRDYNLLSISTFDPFDGGYQIPQVTYHFEEDALCEISVVYTYKNEQDIKWYSNMVEWMESTYEKDNVSEIEETEVSRHGATSFNMKAKQTRIQLMTVEWKNHINNYGSLTLSYYPQTNQ